VKSGKVYWVILCCWTALLGLAAPALTAEVHRASDSGAVTLALVVACTVFIAWFWLNGMKDLVYTGFFHTRRQIVPRPAARATLTLPEVVLVYCTCNDFDASSLRRSMRQTYPRVRTVILDDSSDPQYKATVDEFSRETGVEVRRRDARVGFKAGNLNSYLAAASFDYFVILDSDEIIPPTFVERALDYFAARPEAGIVQANHVATRNRNRFMRTFAPGVDAHWPAYQSVKDRYGFLSLLGHGAMVSRECYLAAGGFPHVVAEDLCFSIRARNVGYLTAFAPDIICEEEYPVDYLAFKKRHAKWTQGNMEFIKRFSWEILRSPMRWFEKLDIVLFTYSLPLTSFFFAYLAINLVAFPALHYRPHYSAWLLAPTVVFLVAPMLNDLLTYGRRSRPRDLAV
jgi:cellulose synthase/poly-beta-1,6-N-acetylglucosamine synthase-like glycosyltransferase